MQDIHGRRVTALRLSITDRCNLRCLYCMGEDVEMLPREQLATFEELERLCHVFIRLGVRKIRLTGGEPLLRRGCMGLVERLGVLVGDGSLDELTLTTNGVALRTHAGALIAAGIRRINVSLDSLSPSVFKQITRGGDLARVIDGIAAAREAGLKVRINAVALKGVNEDGFDDLVAWCGEMGLDMALIEEMPVGDGGLSGIVHQLPLSVVRERLSRRWTLVPTDYRSAGPAHYVTVAETGRRLGFIAATTHNFCSDCNRVRVTATGVLHACLGHDDGIDLLGALRSGASEDRLEALIQAAIRAKPQGHAFSGLPGLGVSYPRRGMNVTGG